jgi:hypothetical protein
MRVSKRTARHTEEMKVLQVKRSQCPGFQSFYADNVQMSVNFYGVSLLLGEVVEVDESSIQVSDRARVHMSPEHAVELHRLLGERIEKYRMAFGQIRQGKSTRQKKDDTSPTD